MILLIGNGYIARAISQQLILKTMKNCHARHTEVDSFWKAHELLKALRPELVINAAAFIPPESVSLCDNHPAETIKGNVLLPTILSAACADQGIPFAHISTGCLWSDGLTHSEEDAPTRAFTGHCGFYIGTKVLAEEEVRKSEKHYIWRVRLPFDQFDGPRNYLSKLANFKQVWVQKNSACHRVDFAKACLDLWAMRAPFGTYNMVNPGVLSVSDIVARMQLMGLVKTLPEFVLKKDGECFLSSQKLISTGVKIRNVEEAVDESLENWVKY